MPPPGSSPQKPRILAAIPATGKSQALFASSALRAACTEFMGHPCSIPPVILREVAGSPRDHGTPMQHSSRHHQDLHGIARSRCEITRGDSATALRSAQNDMDCIGTPMQHSSRHPARSRRISTGLHEAGARAREEILRLRFAPRRMTGGVDCDWDTHAASRHPARSRRISTGLHEAGARTREEILRLRFAPRRMTGGVDCDWDTHAASLPSSCAKSQDLQEFMGHPLTGMLGMR